MHLCMRFFVCYVSVVLSVYTLVYVRHVHVFVDVCLFESRICVVYVTLCTVIFFVHIFVNYKIMWIKKEKKFYTLKF